MNRPVQEENTDTIPISTPKFRTELADKLKDLVPEVLADGKIDIHKLQELLGDDVSDETERFGLFWPGKKRAIRAAQNPTSATLKPNKARSQDWDVTGNVFIEGDNLEVLKILQRSYHNKVDLIYIDPPYNTGKDFVYPDNYKEGLKNYLEYTNQLDEAGRKINTNSETSGRYHSNWLNMMYPRLKLARNLLKDNGLIFISIDDNELAQLRRICDEIFSENNFYGALTWVKRTKPTNMGKSKRSLQSNIEYVLVYGRSSADSFEGFNLPTTTVKAYPHVNEDGREYRLEEVVQRRNLGSMRRDSMVYTLLDVDPKPNYRWQLSPGSRDQLLSKNELIKKGNRIYQIVWKDEENADNQEPFWSHREGTGTAEAAKAELDQLMGAHHLFETVKPLELIRQILLFSTDKNSLILDFFAGTATTHHAVMEMNSLDKGNRRVVSVQLPEPTEEKDEAFRLGYKKVSDISIERIRRAGTKISKDSQVDTGFRVYELADTNFGKWQTGSLEDVEVLQQKLLSLQENINVDADQETILTEILIKLGAPLTAKTTQTNKAGLTFWQLESLSSIAYLDLKTKPEAKQLQALAGMKPSKFIILEDAFKGDDELKTNLAQICKTSGIELWTL